MIFRTIGRIGVLGLLAAFGISAWAGRDPERNVTVLERMWRDSLRARTARELAEDLDAILPDSYLQIPARGAPTDLTQLRFAIKRTFRSRRIKRLVVTGYRDYSPEHILSFEGRPVDGLFLEVSDFNRAYLVEVRPPVDARRECDQLFLEYSPGGVLRIVTISNPERSLRLPVTYPP